MKKIPLLTTLVLVFAFAGCKKNEDPSTNSDPVSLNGNWTGTGYTCATATTIPQQTIGIVESQGKLTATKVTGDACVPAGRVTFTGTYNDKTKVYDIYLTTGTASSPASSTSTPGSLTVVNNNRLEAIISGQSSLTLIR